LGQSPKQTRGWDDAAGVTRGQRSKEESSDYRYFPDPDLVPVTVTPQQIEEVRQSLGELPAALRRRLETDYGLSTYDADVLVNQGQEVVDYFLAVADGCGDGKAASNWVTQDVLRVLKETDATIGKFPISSASLSELIGRIKAGALPSARAREVFQVMIDQGVEVAQVMDALGITTVDESELIALCEKLVAANPKIVADVQSGKTQAVAALIGQAKKANPNVDPGRVREICLELIQSAN
jgi:aspartyl-tRNA(Asn)/glutamyl-tRNA(Gln) amidotransferase subunit B